jgi:periplasmic protein TonB
MRKPALVASLAIHVVAGLLLFLAGAVTGHLTRPPRVIPISIPLHAPPRLPAVKGGGGQNSPLPARRGRAPTPVVHRVFMPPLVTMNEHPRLVVEQALMEAPELNIANSFLGDPQGFSALGAGGPGRLQGIGSGGDGGIGPGDGSKLGGRGDQPRARVTRNPEVIHKEEPEYSDEARRARLEGTVVLAIDIGLDGHPANIRVVRGAGLGLNERAIEAVRKWIFRPALAGDRPVVAPAVVEVGFHLL